MNNIINLKKQIELNRTMEDTFELLKEMYGRYLASFKEKYGIAEGENWRLSRTWKAPISDDSIVERKYDHLFLSGMDDFLNKYIYQHKETYCLRMHIGIAQLEKALTKFVDVLDDERTKLLQYVLQMKELLLSDENQQVRELKAKYFNILYERTVREGKIKFSCRFIIGKRFENMYIIAHKITEMGAWKERTVKKLHVRLMEIEIDYKWGEAFFHADAAETGGIEHEKCEKNSI